MRLLLIFLIALPSIQCSKEPLYEPVEKQYFDFELQTSHYYQIRRGTFQVRLIEVISDGVSKSSVIQIANDSFFANKLPFKGSFSFTQAVWDSLTKNNKSYFIDIKWDSDGNGSYCNGDLIVDSELEFPQLKLSEKKKRFYLKERTHGVLCHPGL